MKLSPLKHRRLANFRGNRRGVVSLGIFLLLMLICLPAEFVANDKPILVRHAGRFYMPALQTYPETAFGGVFETEADYQDPFVTEELVRDRGTKEPFEPSLALHARVKAEGLARGLICYPGAGTADGERGDHVIISPPFIVTETEIDEIVELLGDALDAALASAGV